MGKGSDGAKDLDGVDGLDLASIVRAEEVEDLASGDDDLLGFAADEVSIDGADDASGLLEGEAVEIHCGRECGVGLKTLILQMQSKWRNPRLVGAWI